MNALALHSRQTLRCLGLMLALLVTVSTPAAGQALRWDAPHAANPVIPGTFADPALLQYEGRYYLYATIEPWGQSTLGAWESGDLRNWTYRELNWPTKAAASSATSSKAMVWAPSVVRGRNGRFYLYVSVGSEVWVGEAAHPLGPWRNALGDQPLIAAGWNKAYHMIDAEAFIDDGGSAYLYWGSGFNWVNGHCFVVKLKPDMIHFDGEPRDVTPANYFEGPFMYKHAGRYHLMYSAGKTTEDSYRVHAAESSSPLGPFTEGPHSPVLVSDVPRQIVSPGHHAMFEHQGQSYILYHRHSIPYAPGSESIGRQIALDRVDFDAQGHMLKVWPTHEGPAFLQGVKRADAGIATQARASASSRSDAVHDASRVLDDNYATQWQSTANGGPHWLQLDLGTRRALKSSELRFAYPSQRYVVLLQVSDDARDWRTVGERDGGAIIGSPTRFEHVTSTRYLRLLFPQINARRGVGIIEWRVE